MQEIVEHLMSNIPLEGGTVESIEIEPENLGLLVKINSSDNGKIILELPRES